MKTNTIKTTHQPFLPDRLGLLPMMAAFAALFIAFAPHALAQSTWSGSLGDGGNGDWASTNFTPTGLPANTSTVIFDGDASFDTQTNAVVTIKSNTIARARYLYVRNDKDVTLQFDDGASFLGTSYTNALVSVGQGATNPSNMKLTFAGPTGAGTSATANIGRLYLEGNNTNVGTSYMKSLVFSGNLNANITHSFNAVDGRAEIVVLDGVNISTVGTNMSSEFYARKVSVGGKVGNVYENRISLLGGSVAAKLFRVYSLLQLGENAQLSMATGATNLEVEVRDEGRFEVAGDGLAANALIDVQDGGTLGIGLTDQTTGLRSGAAEFTLKSTAVFATNSMLDFSFFGSAQSEADHITLDGSGVLSGRTTLLLNFANGFVPTNGDSWSLLTGTTSSITATFDFSQVDTNVWDLSAFNQAGDWTVSVIPEPGSGILLLTFGMLLTFLGTRRNLFKRKYNTQ